MTVLIQDIQQYERFHILGSFICHLIEKLGMAFRHILSSLLPLHHFVTEETVLAQIVQVLFYLGSRRTHDVNVDGKTVCGFPENQHQACTTLEMERTTRLCQQVKKRKGMDYFLYEVLVMDSKFNRLFLHPFLCKAFCGNHCSSKFLGSIFLLLAYLFKRLSLMSYKDLAFSII